MTEDTQKAAKVIDLDKAIEDAVTDKPKFKGIAVCGSHPATVQQAPFDDPEWLIYACSPHNLDYYSLNGEVMEVDEKGNKRPRQQRYLNGGRRPDGGVYRVDQWFEVHATLADVTRPYSYLKELEKLERVWVRDGEGLMYMKGAREYPEKEMKERFNVFAFTSSIAFIMAKAIADCEEYGIDMIGIFGVMQASQTEYENQRPGIQYFIDLAQKKGIKVGVPEEAKHLFNPPPETW